MSDATIRLYTLEQAEQILKQKRKRKIRWYKKQMKRKIRRAAENFAVWAAPKAVGLIFISLSYVCYQLEEITMAAIIFFMMGIAVMFGTGRE